MKYYQIPSRLVAVVFAAPLSLLLSSQATAQIYSQTFNTGASTSLDDVAIGWSAYENDGTDLSSSTGDPMYVAADGRVFIGSSSANQGGAYAILSDAPTIDTTQYETDLTISWAQGGNDRDIDDPILGWRVLAEVAGEWYASEFQEFTGFSTMSVVVANSTWQSWATAETDLTNGFTFASGDFDAATTISGNITKLGLLAIDGSSANNDSLVLNNSFEVTGTAIPEPSSCALLSGVLGLGWVVLRRRD